MTATIKALSDGLSGELQVGGSPALRFGADTSGQMPGFRNKIINGKMEIAQRGTSFAAIADTAYSLDRWINRIVGAGVVTASQQTDVPSNNEFYNSLRYTVTTADTSIGATDLYAIQQRIEGSNVRNLIGNTFTLSFWVRSAKTGTHCVSFHNSIADRSYVVEYTINAANTWEKKTILLSGGLITAGTWNWTNGIGLIVGFSLAAGSNYQASAGSWQSSFSTATSNQVNCLDTAGNIFAITGVQLEAGSIATSFEHRPIGTELALCQRYYYKINSEATSNIYGTGGNNGPTQAIVCTQFPVPMRAAPTAVEQSGTASHYETLHAGSQYVNNAVPTFHSASTKFAVTTNNNAGSMVTGGATIARFTSTSGFVAWGSEL